MGKFLSSRSPLALSDPLFVASACAYSLKFDAERVSGRTVLMKTINNWESTFLRQLLSDTINLLRKQMRITMKNGRRIEPGWWCRKWAALMNLHRSGYRSACREFLKKESWWKTQVMCLLNTSTLPIMRYQRSFLMRYSIIRNTKGASTRKRMGLYTENCRRIFVNVIIYFLSEMWKVDQIWKKGTSRWKSR